MEERTAIAELTFKLAFKSALSTIPFIGPFVSDVLFEYRSKIKQDRVMRFVEILKEEFQARNPNINIENIKSEEFSDLLENVFRKVSLTRNNKKLIAFKNILLKGVEANAEIEYCEIFAELLNQLSEKQIEILSVHFNRLDKYGYTLTNIRNLERHYELTHHRALSDVNFGQEEENVKVDLERIRKGFNENRQFQKEIFFNLSESEFKFYVQDLYNKGLFYDEGVGSLDVEAFELMIVTDFGKKFLEFIESTTL